MEFQKITLKCRHTTFFKFFFFSMKCKEKIKFSSFPRNLHKLLTLQDILCTKKKIDKKSRKKIAIVEFFFQFN